MLKLFPFWPSRLQGLKQASCLGKVLLASLLATGSVRFSAHGRVPLKLSCRTAAKPPVHGLARLPSRLQSTSAISTIIRSRPQPSLEVAATTTPRVLRTHVPTNSHSLSTTTWRTVSQLSPETLVRMIPAVHATSECRRPAFAKELF